MKRSNGVPSIRAFFLLLSLTACTSLPDRIQFAAPSADAEVERIFVSSGLLPSTRDTDLRQDRAELQKYAVYDVSIPPTHELGQIEWPNGTPNASTDFVVVGQKELGSREQFLRQLARQQGDDVTVFVHGYNTTPSEALYRLAQISYDFGDSSPKFLFSWPSAGATTGYVYDRDSVAFSRDPFADLLTAISRETDKKVTLLAHSMGTLLAMEGLRQLSLTGRNDVLEDIRTVALLAPDIDPDVFRGQLGAITPLPDPFVIMTNRNDRALYASAFLNYGRQRVGDLSRAEDIAGFDVTVFDFTAVADGSNSDHLVPFTSPAAISIMRDLVNSNSDVSPDFSGFVIGRDGVIRAKPAGT